MICLYTHSPVSGLTTIIETLSRSKSSAKSETAIKSELCKNNAYNYSQ